MKRITCLFSILIIIACSNDPEEQIANLNGYWQIEKVELENDSVVNYSLSQYVDYIEIKDSVGFRKKLQPRLDGTYIEVSENAEKISAEISENELILNYSTPFDSWTERVISAKEESFVVITEDGKKYYYKKYKPLLTE